MECNQTKTLYERLAVTYPSSCPQYMAKADEVVRVERTADMPSNKVGEVYLWHRNLYKIKGGKYAGRKIFFLEDKRDGLAYAYFLSCKGNDAPVGILF